MAAIADRIRTAALLVAAVPALTGFPLSRLSAPWLPGLSWGPLAYFLTANFVVLWVGGQRRYADWVAVAALVACPVVFGGGLVAAAAHLVGLGPEPGHYGVHYVSLALSILTVVPLALALMSRVPVRRLEYRLLTGSRGVSRGQKAWLMVVRVFTHILFTVLPRLLEVMREEGLGRRRAAAGDPAEKPRLRERLQALSRIGVAGICMAVQFVPLWAEEIAALPDKPGRRRQGNRI